MERTYPNGRASLEKRFLSRVIRTSNCWGWSGTKKKTGYATLIEKGKEVRAHRLSYQLNVGKIPQGQHVLHKCDNPPCCNPRHLFLGTHQDNMRDKKIKGRHARKLNWEKVSLIRKRCKKGWNKQGGAILSKEFNVSAGTIYEIVSNKTWKI